MRIARGFYLGSANRNGGFPEDGGNVVGFRVVLAQGQP